MSKSQAKKGTTDSGYINKNGQKVVRHTGERGSNEFAWKYELECTICGHRYGANGFDIHERKCPNTVCPSGQHGKPGLPLKAAHHA